MAEIRTFVAVDLGPEVRNQLALIQGRLKKQVPNRSVRWVRPEGIHLTLKFLGNIRDDRVQEIVSALRGACAPISPFAFTVGGSGCFPNPKRPSVAWIGVEDPSGALKALQEAAERALNPLGFPPEGRAFKPHLTLGRTNRSASSSELASVGECIRTNDVGILGQVEVREIVFMKSDLLPDGARYTPLAHIPLGGAEA
jgi:2'-5' RNA ligase